MVDRQTASSDAFYARRGPSCRTLIGINGFARRAFSRTARCAGRHDAPPFRSHQPNCQLVGFGQNAPDPSILDAAFIVGADIALLDCAAQLCQSGRHHRRSIYPHGADHPGIDIELPSFATDDGIAAFIPRNSQLKVFCKSLKCHFVVHCLLYCCRSGVRSPPCSALAFAHSSHRAKRAVRLAL